MKVVINVFDDYPHFVEITEEQYKFWKWLEKEINCRATLDDIEITKIESLTYETID